MDFLTPAPFLPVLAFGSWSAVAIFPSYHGLAVKAGPTEIPQAVTRGVVATIVAIFVSSAIFVVIAA